MPWQCHFLGGEVAIFRKKSAKQFASFLHKLIELPFPLIVSSPFDTLSSTLFSILRNLDSSTLSIVQSQHLKMPRSRGGSGGRGRPSAPSRPTAAPARPAAAPSQQSSRGASTAAHPPANAQQTSATAQQQGKSPGLFGQMASTAA